jgi:hypothetical protein
MSDCTIRTASDVYGFVAQLKIDTEKCGDTDLARELDEALHLGSSGLEILGAIRKTLIENQGAVESLLGSDGWQKAARVFAFVDKTFGR